MDDYLQMLLLPACARAYSSEAAAPIEVRPGREAEQIEMLIAGELDVFVGRIRAAVRHPDLRSTRLGEDVVACIARRHHPDFRDALNADEFWRARHVVMGDSDSLMGAGGMHQQVGVVTADLLAIPSIVAHSDLIATVPRRLAQWYAAPLRLAVFEPPVVIPAYEINLLWTERGEMSPAVSGVRDRIASAAATRFNHDN